MAILHSYFDPYAAKYYVLNQFFHLVQTSLVLVWEARCVFCTSINTVDWLNSFLQKHFIHTIFTHPTYWMEAI